MKDGIRKPFVVAGYRERSLRECYENDCEGDELVLLGRFVTMPEAEAHARYCRSVYRKTLHHIDAFQD